MKKLVLAALLALTPYGAFAEPATVLTEPVINDPVINGVITGTADLGGGGGELFRFNTRDDAASADIAASTGSIYIAGHSVIGQGGGWFVRTGAPTGELADGDAGGANQCLFEGKDGTWWWPNPDQPLTITMCGARGNNAATDDPAIHDALTIARYLRPPGVLPVYVPAMECFRTDEPILLREDLAMIGSGSFAMDASEAHACIRNTKTNMFKFAGTGTAYNVRGVLLRGIAWEGNSSQSGGNGSEADPAYNHPTDFFTEVRSSDGAILEYSRLEYNYFSEFNYVFKNRMLGVWLENNTFNNSDCAGEFYGSDNIVSNNFVALGGREKDPNAFVWRFDSFSLSRIEKNFFTGRPAKIARFAGKYMRGTIFSQNWVDISDQAGVALEGAEGLTISNNTFHRLMLGGWPAGTHGSVSGKTSSTYDAMLVISGSNDIAVAGNQFFYSSSSDDLDANTYSIKGGSRGVVLSGNIYYGGHARKINVDSSSEQPRIFE